MIPIRLFCGSILIGLFASAAHASRGPAPPDSGAIADSILARLGPDTCGFPLVNAATHAQRRTEGDLPGKSPAIRVGEKLTFSVRYGMVHAGEATMEIVGIESISGHPCYHVVSRARSNTVFDTVYRVRDLVESWMDVDRLFSRQFHKKLQEGNYRAEQTVEMDQDNRFARYADGQVSEIAPGAHDVLSAFYYVRTRNLTPGEEFELESHADRKNYPLKVHVHGRERIECPAGTFDCIVVEPMLRTPGLFKSEGTLTLWLTDDERKMPVLMRSKIAIGSISVVLTDYKRP